MALVKQFDKRSGITYVYESKSYWDKEKKQSRSKRTLVGRLDPMTGEILPTDGRGRRRGKGTKEGAVKPGPVPSLRTDRLFYGATYLFDQIGEETGVTADLKACFPKHYKQILSLAYYLILEDQNPLYRFKKWSKLHHHPHGQDIPSQRSSDIFQLITEEAKMKFFRLQGKRRVETEYWAYDSTSISSCSETLRQVRYGHNKDGEKLPQVNLALLFGEESGLPFYYRKLAGNIPDVKTVRQLLKELDILGYSKVKLMMDRGYYSKDNINALYKAHVKFLCGSTTRLSFVQEYIREIGSGKDDYAAFNSRLDLYVFSKTITWDYEQERPYKGDVLKSQKRMYLHLYYNPDKHVDDVKALNRKLEQFEKELASGQRKPEHEKDYRKYFVWKETPKRGIQLSYKQDEIDAARERYGFFVLISNEVKDPVTAVQLYRMRDVIEKAFWNVKERLNLRRTLVSSESALEGKFFVEFIALIYLSYINKKMEEEGLYADYTMHELLDELDVIECFTEPGKAPIPGEVLKKQEDIYKAMGVKPLLTKPII